MKLLIVLVLGILYYSQSDAQLANYMHLFNNHREPAAPKIQSTRAATQGFVTQRLDNFNAADTRTFQARFFANDQFYTPGGPIFIYVGGWWEIQSWWVLGGHMFDMAREMNGYIFYTEHRFYGQSRPTANLNFQNLQFLSLDQGIEDLANFIRIQRATIPGAANSGVILVGASYAATMVSWFRQRHPELVRGSWASGGPLYAEADFGAYNEVVGYSVGVVSGNACHNRIARAFSQMGALVDAGNFARLDSEFNTCRSLSVANQQDIWNFFDMLSNMMAAIVQNHWTTEINQACNIITNPAITDDISAYAAFVASLISPWCLDYTYDGLVAYFAATGWTSAAANNQWRQWLYQTCNEFGWYQTLSSTNQPFGLRTPVTLYKNVCRDAYSSTLTPAAIEAGIQRTNTRNFGLRPTFTNVFTTHGQLDPWRPAGIQTAINPLSPVTVIPMASHCQDLDSISNSDSYEMRAAKLQIRQLVIQWLA